MTDSVFQHRLLSISKVGALPAQRSTSMSVGHPHIAYSRKQNCEKLEVFWKEGQSETAVATPPFTNNGFGKA